jgi:hypothetical protein
LREGIEEKPAGGIAVPLQKPDMQVKHDLQGVGSSPARPGR